MSCSTAIRQASRLFLLLGCTCLLSSCSTIGSILGYLLSLPGNLIKAFIP